MAKMLFLLKDEEGATAIEYGLIIAIFTLGILAAMSRMGNAINNTYGSVSSNLATASR